MIWQLIDSSSVGGAERHIATLADGLRRAGHPTEIVLLARHGVNPWLAQLAEAGLPQRHLDGSLKSVRAALVAARPSLLHTHGYKAGIFGRIAARAAGIPVVSTFHSGARGAFPVGAYEWLDDWTSGLGARIAVSETIQKRLPFTSRVIPSYVRTAEQPPAGPLPRVAGFVGRLSQEKAPDLFCQLAARARNAGNSGLSWHVWGDGPMRQALQAEHGTYVTFHGIATQMDTVWPQIGVLVMPSHFEGVPLAALEAAALGIPLLASRVGGLPTVVADGETGWLFPVGDLSAAEAGLHKWQSICESKELDTLRQACWTKVRAEFSEQRWLPEVVKVYRAAGLAVDRNQL
jgi:glycosyltransferase involved in cell wall biosynthesis